MSKVVSTDVSMDAHPSSFQRWKFARTTLTRAIDDYLTASVGLCDALSAPACHPSSRHSLEQTLSEIDLELSSLHLEEEKLKQMRATLANERNRSATLTPVHKLPSEILSAIFAISSSRYNRYDRTKFSRALRVSPTVLAGVCSSWRRLALRCPSLWSYVDLIIGNELDPRHSMQVVLWVERSQNVPLYVSIRDHNRQDGNVQHNTGWRHVDRLAEFLAPLMHHVCALDISATLEDNEALSSAIECWIKNGSTDIKKTLQVVSHPKHFSEELSDLLFEPQSDAEGFNAFFQTINRLFLRNFRISEPIKLHEGLVELHLEEFVLHHCPTQRGFVEMLAACPRLRVLALGNYWVEPSEEDPCPVTLNHLQSLSLETDNSLYSLAPVLPLLLIGSDTLAVSLTLEDNLDFIDEVKAFFNRTKVTTLCVRNRGHRSSSLAALLSGPIPYLETLAIEHFEIFGPAFQHFFGSNGDDRGEVLWPRLHTLYLKDSSINASYLRKLVLLHPSIKKLHIYRPRQVGQRDEYITDEECDHLDESMNMVDDYCVDFGSGNGPIDTWDFVILEE